MAELLLCLLLLKPSAGKEPAGRFLTLCLLLAAALVIWEGIQVFWLTRAGPR